MEKESCFNDFSRAREGGGDWTIARCFDFDKKSKENRQKVIKSKCY